jgi:hypothetical protein
MEEPSTGKVIIPNSAWKENMVNELLIFVSGLGHPKGFHDDAQIAQGLLQLNIDGQDRIKDVSILPGFFSKRTIPVHLKDNLKEFKESPIIRLQATFTLPETPKQVIPWGIHLQEFDFERMNLYLNGILVGRYWKDCRCQEMFYLLPGIMKTETGAQNTLELILINFKPFIEPKRLSLKSHQTSITPYEVYTKCLSHQMERV